ncbi:hypothetical protein MSAN_01549200 [Mycena sanguinolenta]|uniref:Uncharacterized protein n=1 Tax=Mycena sanguinolenta TaxID=230812 RepID=A0A8H6XZG0_9AGAR|nr:hypothetical protein MSAN_01549200 [Mycena sanguinolenta]
MCLQSPSLLLGLPTELRLQIYDGVVHLPIDCRVATGDSHRQHALWRQPPAAQLAPVLTIPWFSLMLVCKTITEELRDYLYTSGNTTYELEIDNTDLKWGSVRILQANLALHFGTGFWGCGGPNPILSQLYQVLNRFIHNGPLLARRSPLVNHIHLNTLIVQVCVRDPDPEERRAQGLKPYGKAMVDDQKKQHRCDLQRYVSEVVERGLLFGAMDKIVCRLAEGEFDDKDKVREWEVSSKEIGDMTEWEQYGFEWGVPGSSSLAGHPSQSDVSP